MYRRTLFSVTLAAIVAFAVGCQYAPVSNSGTGFKLAERTSGQIELTKSQIDTAEAQMDATLATLAGMMEQPEIDATQAWNQLVRDIDALRRQADRVQWQNDRMLQQGKFYFDSWGADLEAIENPELRSKSEAQRSQQLAQYQQMESALSATGTAFDSLFTDLEDMKQYLSIDLTPASRSAASDLHQRVREDGGQVKQAAARARNELNRMQAVLSPGQPAQSES